ncbi:hypothetical protein CAPTEDRAFT_217391 [Capitella teleta]|uniref:ZSWIM3 N-terminal domain-containing protein n=1 Tax=Capitella teleta TaxID=283909 RepID=R7ULS3_CAPTE|nr:hypothetical protein CAPTEDRAFT_217391 [Capitella teleta]|eukprot:ELU04887.1 hypothetical protein CAPTEDRAFT_217391 [Capitella teleta]
MDSSQIDVPEIYVSVSYDAWATFFLALQRFADSTCQPFIKNSCRLAAKANARIKNGPYFLDSEDLRYSYYDFRCTHRGKYKSRKTVTGNGGKEPKYKSFKDGCKAKVYTSVDKETKKVVIRELIQEHCPEIYRLYPQTRLLNKEEKAEVRRYLKLKVSTKVVRDHVEGEFGKSLNLHDVRNVKQRIRQEVS